MEVREQNMSLWRPGWRTVPKGAVLWLRYTHSQWVRAVVVAFNTQTVCVIPKAGTYQREIRVPWTDVAFDPPVGALV